MAEKAVMHESDDSRELNKLYRCAAADKEFLRSLIGQERKRCRLIHEHYLSQKSLDLLIEQEDDYSDDHYRKYYRQKFLRSYTFTVQEEEKGVEPKYKNWLKKKQESMRVYRAVNKVTKCYKLCYVINTALLSSCNYVAEQYRCLSRIMKRSV
ncbi:hypothetical protein AgCh_016780 [Apium graveolens]